MSNEIEKIDVGDLKHIMEYLAELDKRETTLTKAIGEFHKSITEPRESLVKWRNTRLRAFIGILICIACLFLILSFLPISTLTSIFQNLFTEIVGAIITFILIDQFWYPGEVNVQIMNSMLNRLSKYQRKLEYAKLQTNATRKAYIEYYANLQEKNIEDVEKFLDKVKEQKKILVEIRTDLKSVFEDILDFVEDTKTSTKSDVETKNRMKDVLTQQLRNLQTEDI